MKSIDSLAGDSHDGPSAHSSGPHAEGATGNHGRQVRSPRWRIMERKGPTGHPQQVGGLVGMDGLAECRAMTERQLLECFVTANDPDAFRVLIERHGPKVLAVCRDVLRTRHDAEDVFQDTFLALARIAHTIKHGERHRPVAPSSGPPHGTEGTVQGLPTSGSREESHRLQNGVSHRRTRLVSDPVTPRRGQSLASKLPAARGALLPGGEKLPGGRSSVELPHWDDQGAALEGATNPA